MVGRSKFDISQPSIISVHMTGDSDRCQSVWSEHPFCDSVVMAKRPRPPVRDGLRDAVPELLAAGHVRAAGELCREALAEGTEDTRDPSELSYQEPLVGKDPKESHYVLQKSTETGDGFFICIRTSTPVGKFGTCWAWCMTLHTSMKRWFFACAR